MCRCIIQLKYIDKNDGTIKSTTIYSNMLFSGINRHAAIISKLRNNMSPIYKFTS